MKKKIVFVISIFTLFIFTQNYERLIKTSASRLVVIEFAVEFESRGEVEKRIGKTIGVIYDDSKILTTSIIFEDEARWLKRLRLLPSVQGVAFTNYKPSKTVKVLYDNKEIDGKLFSSDFDKGVAIVRVPSGTFAHKELKFVNKELKVGQKIIVISLLPIKSFNNPVQLIMCDISIELMRGNNKFFQCDKSLSQIPGGLAFSDDLKPIGILSTPELIPQILHDEKDNFMAKYYSLSSVVILSYSQLASIFGKDKKDVRLWLGLLPQTFTIYYEEKLREILKEEGYKVALNIDKVIPNSPLHSANIFENDLVLEINGQKIEEFPHSSNMEILVKLASLLKPLEFITLKIYRRSEDKLLNIKIAPATPPIFWDEVKDIEIKELGIKVKELTVDYKLQRKIDITEKGVVVVHVENIKKEETNKNFSLYDIIKKIDKSVISSVKDINDIISKARKENKKTVSVEVIRSEDNEVWNLKIDLK